MEHPPYDNSNIENPPRRNEGRLLPIETPPINGEMEPSPHINNNKNIFIMAEPRQKNKSNALAIPFEKWEKKESNLEYIGSIKTLMPKGTKVRFVKKNFTNPAKSVVLRLETTDGSLYFVTCSKPVSDLCRGNGVTLAQLLSFPVGKGIFTLKSGEEVEGIRITMPEAGDVADDIIIDDVEEDNSFEWSNDFLPESLAGY